jgi:ribosomal protein S18 acetylase RimI-like enzyme
MHKIMVEISPTLTNKQLNSLFALAWENHKNSDFQQVLSHSLLYLGAFHEEQLIGFVNVAWDGGSHAFLLDTTVHPQFQRQGLGKELVQTATVQVRQRGVEWLHVDYEDHLHSFYEQCGFRPTKAGLINLIDWNL